MGSGEWVTKEADTSDVCRDKNCFLIAGTNYSRCVQILVPQKEGRPAYRPYVRQSRVESTCAPIVPTPSELV